MGEVFAGFVCGYIVALLAAPVLGISLPRLRDSSPLVARVLPAEAPVVPLIVVLHGALIIVCTLAGVILGMLLLALEDGGEAAGSRNVAFTIFVFGFLMAFLAPVAIVFSRLRVPVGLAGVTLLLLFGWLMPHMAAWSKFGSS